MPEAQHIPGDRAEFSNSSGEFQFVGVLGPDGLTWDLDVEATDERKSEIAERLAKRNAAIPGALDSLIAHHGFFSLDSLSLDCSDQFLDKTEDERKLALWNAIVDADASL